VLGAMNKPNDIVPSPTSSFSSHSSELYKITFDLFEVILKIRPSDPVKDLKYDPVKHVILNSSVILSEAAKALKKSWKSILLDNCPIRNSFSSASNNENWRSILSNTYMKKSKLATTSDNKE
ncbi:24895_t:CDS:2, partial [Dentiscutata erythropus]